MKLSTVFQLTQENTSLLTYLNNHLKGEDSSENIVKIPQNLQGWKQWNSVESKSIVTLQNKIGGI